MRRLAACLVLVLLSISPGGAESETVEIEFWRSVKDTTIPQELEAYLDAYPTGQFAPLARLRLKVLRDDSDAQEGARSKTASGTPNDGAAKVLRHEEIAVTLEPLPSDPTKGFMGLELRDVPDLQKSLGLAEAGVAFVASVMPDGAAEKAGVKPGHFIIAVDATATPVAKAVVEAARANLPGTRTTLKIVELASDRDALERALSEKSDSEPAAYFALGLLSQSDAKRISLYRKAAERGYATAMSWLGSAYAFGDFGVAKDTKTAFEWFRKGAHAGDLSAMHSLAVMYGDGIGVAMDQQKAVEWYQKAAEQGYLNSMHNLGLLYLGDDNVAKDSQEALKWFRKAAEGGHTGAMRELGAMYGRGDGVDQDYLRAVEWYRKAAEEGQVDAMFELGLKYARGEGVPKNGTQAIEWLRKAADGDHAGAAFSVGVIYDEGIGIAVDQEKAVSWYKKAVAMGYPTAMNNLGLKYDKGTVVNRDASKAAKLLLDAYRRRDGHARENLETDYDTLSRDTRREVQRLLRQEGVYDRAIDGRFGSGTRAALEALLAAALPDDTASEAKSAGDGAGRYNDGAQTPHVGFDLGDLQTLD